MDDLGLRQLSQVDHLAESLDIADANEVSYLLSLCRRQVQLREDSVEGRLVKFN